MDGSSSSSGKRKAPTADVHEYFTTTTIGNECRKKCIRFPAHYSINSGTSALRSHAHKHGFLLDTVSQKRFTREGGLRATVETPRKEQEERVTRQICGWIINSSLPFLCIEDKEFMKLVSNFDDYFKVPSRFTISHRIKEMQRERRLQIKSLLAKIPGKLSLTTDAWSSKVYKGYIAVTAHWINSNWELQSIVLDFLRFSTPHTGEATCALLYQVMSEWNVLLKVRAITTDNASDICSGVTKLLGKLVSEGHFSTSIEDFHVRCIAHVVKIAVKECLGMITTEISAIRSLINSMRASVKRRELFENVRVELGERVKLPVLKVDTRWSSTFFMMRSAFEARRVFNAVCHRVHDLEEFIIGQVEWEREVEICDFLETAASVTELQSGSCYVTLSMSIKAFGILKRKALVVANGDNQVLVPIAQVMLQKLDSYDSVVCSDLASLAKVCEPRFASDVISDSDLLRRFVQVPEQDQNDVEHSDDIRKKTLFEQLMDESSVDVVDNDEVGMYIRATSCPNRGMDPLNWWKNNQHRYPTIGPLARDILAIQASIVASESTFSDANQVMDEARLRINDETLQASVLLMSWNKLYS